ncbi:MAG: helix-turn-helix transcriptional regulator [Actinomycetota bacterium]
MSNQLEPPSDLSEFLAAGDTTTSRDIDDSPAGIGLRIAEARDSAGLTQGQLGEHLGVLEDTVQDWETGRLAARSNMLARIAGVLGVSLSWLVIGHGVAPTDDEDPRVRELRETVLDVRAQLAALSQDLDRVLAGLGQISN